MNWKKKPRTKIFVYPIGFNPQPSRDDGIGIDVEVHLCCNKLSYWLTYTDGSRFHISENEFQKESPEAYEKFKKDFLKYKHENSKNKLIF